jgi:NAD(P)-dependent dehydrogenase (short-subunit alcohol dehydrogenase family)
VHLLVNNAAVTAPRYQRTVDGFELQMATNFLGHFALTGLLLPQLVEAGGDGGARVVSVTSQAYRLARSAPLADPRARQSRYRAWPTHAQTMLATLLFAQELDRRAGRAGLPVTAIAAHAGLTPTGSRGGILDAARTWLAQSPSEAALPVLMAASAGLPGGSYVGPGGVGQVRGTPRVVTPTRLARDPETAERLWALAEAATGVAYP